MKKFDRAAAAYQKNGFIKTSVDSQQTKSEKLPKKDSKNESGYLKAAKFLLLVGPQQAAEVLKQFSAEDVERIVKEIAAVRKVGKEESAGIIREFGRFKPENKAAQLPAPGETIPGGPDKAKEMLLSAFGAERGQELFDKVLPFGGRKPFDFLDDLQPEQILMILKNEPPYVMSIVLSFLKPELSSHIISKLQPDSRKEIIFRIARQGEIAPGVIDKMEGVFRDRIRAQGRIVTEEIDGKSVLAGILKHMDIRAEESILEELENENKHLAEQIKENIYTVDLLLRMDDKDVQYLLRDFDNSEIAIIIKGKSDSVRTKLLDNLSERRRVMIEEESIYLGEMRRSDVDKSTREFIEYIMELEQKGRIVIPRGDEEWI